MGNFYSHLAIFYWSHWKEIFFTFKVIQVVMDPNGAMAPFYLAGFCAATVTALSIMGGTFAVLPAYEAG